MQCPKCLTPAPEGSAECLRCGIVFAKFQERQGVGARAAAPATDVPRGRESAAGAHPAVLAARAGLLIALAWWTWSFARTPAAALESFLHLPNLVFHEAGHMIFAPFGRFMTVLGGSLLQVLVPVVLSIAFVRQRHPFGAAVCAWWVGQNLVDLAPYIADARSLELVLLGGKTGAEVEGHDWEYLLTQLGVLHMDRSVGRVALIVGLAIMVGALAWSVACAATSPPENTVED